jgi:hypothetical protein
MAFAFDRWQKQARFPDRLDQTELGRRVAARSDRKEPYTQSAVAGWLAGKIPREAIAADALASELGQEPGWLYFDRGDAPAGWKEARVELIAHDRLGERGKKRKRKPA